MTDTNDLNDLAKRYIDLWQEHLGDLAADGEVAKTIARTIELMSGSASAIAAFNMEMAEGAKSNAKSGEQQGPSGTASVVPAHGGPDPDVAKLTRRVAELEKRLDKLEPKAGRARRKTTKRPRKS